MDTTIKAINVSMSGEKAPALFRHYLKDLLPTEPTDKKMKRKRRAGVRKQDH